MLFHGDVMSPHSHVMSWFQHGHLSGHLVFFGHNDLLANQVICSQFLRTKYYENGYHYRGSLYLLIRQP